MDANTQQKSDNDAQAGALPPLFKTYEEACAYCEKTGDNYYASAFLLEMWLGSLITDAVQKYADRNPNKREMQTGEAVGHMVFRKLFAECTDGLELAGFLQHLCRFAQQDDNFAEIILGTYGLFGTENSVRPVVDVQKNPTVSAFRTYAARLCDWLDCQIHWRTHFMYYHAPGGFMAGDEEARHLFSLGLSETALPELSAYDQRFWRWNHESAVRDLTRPDKWKFVADGVKNDDRRTHTHPEVDDCVICFWPLVKRFNWSYAELLIVLDRALPRCSGRYPCDSAVSLQKHCNLTVGLKKGVDGQRGTSGRPTRQLDNVNPKMPEGFEVVEALMKNQADRGEDGEGK